MNQMLIHKTSGKSFVLICLILLMQTSLVWAAEEITGDWEVTMDFNARKSYAALSITKNEDGTLKGKWGRYELDDVKFQDGKLTFSRTMGPSDRQWTTDYEGTLKDGKLMLTIVNDWGELSAVGVRPKPMCPALGHWDLKFDVGDREINARLSISQKPDGTMIGKWAEEGEHEISDVKFKDGKLTFTRKSKIEDFEFETTYDGTIKKHKLTGMLKGEMGEWQANGQRVGTELIGEWELTTTSEWGTGTTTMKIFGDLTGRYEFFGSELPMKDIKLEGDQLTFIIEMGWGDRTFQMDFKGKLDGKNLKGQMNSDRGTSEITGKKVEKVKATAPAEKKTPAAESKKSEN